MHPSNACMYKISHNYRSPQVVYTERNDISYCLNMACPEILRLIPHSMAYPRYRPWDRWQALLEDMHHH